MANFDVFNGDADGVLSLVQLRLAEPREATLVTGVKRNIALLKNVDADAGDQVTVLDISAEKNIDALQSLLSKGAAVFYADHHRAPPLPEIGALEAHIDLDPNTCTALIINDLLKGEFVLWAIAAAYGDNMIASADALVAEHGVSTEDALFLKDLGILVNYNGYGAALDDLHFDPAVLFKQLVQFKSPLQLRDQDNSVYWQLKRKYDQDMAHVNALTPFSDNEVCAAFELPNQPWAKRVSGVFGNDLANAAPHRAHAVFTLNPDGNSYTVSLRAPLLNKQGAGDICSGFESGGGRAAAGGVNTLPIDQKMAFVEAVQQYYG